MVIGSNRTSSNSRRRSCHPVLWAFINHPLRFTDVEMMGLAMQSMWLSCLKICSSCVRWLGRWLQRTVWVKIRRVAPKWVSFIPNCPCGCYMPPNPLSSSYKKRDAITSHSWTLICLKNQIFRQIDRYPKFHWILALLSMSLLPNLYDLLTRIETEKGWKENCFLWWKEIKSPWTM